MPTGSGPILRVVCGQAAGLRHHADVTGAPWNRVFGDQPWDGDGKIWTSSLEPAPDTEGLTYAAQIWERGDDRLYDNVSGVVDIQPPWLPQPWRSTTFPRGRGPSMRRRQSYSLLRYEFPAQKEVGEALRVTDPLRQQINDLPAVPPAG